jgi:hypothetical protein
MPSIALQDGEALTKGTILVSTRLAIVDLWGEAGWRDVAARLPEDARQTMTRGELTALGWYPTRFAQDCGRALLAGPGGGKETELRRFVRRSVDLGFGRIRRALLRLATPEMLASRAASLWRHNHSVGDVSIEEMRAGAMRIVLRGHPFVEPPLSNIAFAEGLRHIVSLSGASDVRETHTRKGSGLVVSLTWSTG